MEETKGESGGLGEPELGVRARMQEPPETGGEGSGSGVSRG